MTAYTIAGNGTLRDIGNASIWGVATARSGGDTIDLNGFTITQDQDSRYGLSGTTSTTWGNITVNAAKGGKFIIDARKVWLIPFTGGSGTLTLGTQINIGGVTCNTVGIYSALNSAPTTSSGTGWLKVTNASGTPGTISNGTYAGFTLTANGAAIRGFIEVNGDESAGFIGNRLGSIEMYGAWFEAGTTSGSSATTYQLPTHGQPTYFPAVWVDSPAATVTAASYSGGFITYTVASHEFHVGEEVTVTGSTPAGYNVTDAVITARTATTFTIAASDPGTWSSGGSAVVPECYPNAGSLVAASSTATDIRGKCCWVSSAGVLRFGSDGTNTVGYVPPSGRRIRIPNILTSNNTTAARTNNVLPNATLATRYDWTTTGGGVTIINKALLNWYPSFSQSYSLSMTYVGVATQLSITELAQPLTMVQVCVGQEAANTQTGLIMGLCFAGGTVNSCTFSRAALATAVYVSTLTDISDFTFNNTRYETRLVKANVGAGSINATRALDCVFNGTKIVGAKVLLTGCSDTTFTSTSYADRITGTTQTTAAENNSVWELVTAASYRMKFDGLDFFGITNVHPYLQVLNVGVAGCVDVKLRNIGTSPSSTLSLGSANQTGTLATLINGSAASDVKVQRCFVSNTRTNLITMDNSATRITLENVMGDYADVPVASGLNLIFKSVGATPTYAAQTAVYGTHWWDHFTSATVGRIAIVMNEPTTQTASQVALTNGAAFTSAGGLYMPTVGMTATFEMPHFALGHSSFTNTALVMAGGGAVGNFTFAYQIDTGSGFGAWSSELTAAGLGTSLNGLSISASTGFKLKLRITTGTANTTAITSVYVVTGSSAAAQANYHPLDTNTLTLTGIVAGTDVVILTSGTTTVLASTDAQASSTYVFTYSGAQTVDVRLYRPGHIPYFVTGLALTTVDSSLPVSQVADPSYVE